MNIFTVHYRPPNTNILKTVNVVGADKWAADAYFRAHYEGRIYAVLFLRAHSLSDV